MDRYVRVDQRKGGQEDIKENECLKRVQSRKWMVQFWTQVRIMSSGKIRNYITYATALIKDKGQESVVLKAMGKAINKTVTIAEILKRRIPGLHQSTEIGSMDITDTWEPLEEGLNRLETTRHVSMIVVTLSKEPIKPNSPGYQMPLSGELVKPLQNNDGIEIQDHEEVADRSTREGGQQNAPIAGVGRGRGGGRGRGRARGRSRRDSAGRSGGRNSGSSTIAVAQTAVPVS